MQHFLENIIRNFRKVTIPSDRLSLAQIKSLLLRGHIGGDESFLDWLNRANQVPMDDVPYRMAEYLYGLGVNSLRWEQAGPWSKDERVSVTYLIVGLADWRTSIREELDYLGNSYAWKEKSGFANATQQWVSEIWLEYHSAPVKYRPLVLQTLEEARIGDITYPVWLSLTGASTDVGVLAKLLTANGILDVRVEPEPTPGAERWSSYLIVNLPPGELSRNPNMSPYGLSQFVASMLRNPYTFFFMKTEVWVPLEMKLPLDARQEERIREFQGREKWWR